MKCMLCTTEFTKIHDDQKVCVRCFPTVRRELLANPHKYTEGFHGYLGEEYEEDEI